MSDNDYEYELKAVNLLSPSFLQSKWRVKLYHLNMIGQWDDMGTGHVSIKTEEEELYIKMVSEINNDTMFELKLTSELIFHRQRGTILTWKSKKEEDDDDTAISFQDEEGIREVWKLLCSFQGTDPQEDKFEVDDEDDQILPEPIVEHLTYIAREIRPDIIPPNRAIRILEQITLNKGAYIKKLGEILEQEEKKLEEGKKSELRTDGTDGTKQSEETDTKNTNLENLSLIFTIFKNLFSVADQNTLELLLSDDLYLVTFGALEYDFESQKMIKHRQFFKEIAQFKNILDINDSSILQKIHLNYRLAYLRDTAIGRFIEEITIKNVNILIHYNNSDIIQYFLSNKGLLKIIIDRMRDNNLDKKTEGTMFLLELISNSKELLQTRIYFYEALCELNIIETIEQILIDINHDSNYTKYLGSLKQVNNVMEVTTILENSKREMLKINSIEILINILTVVPHILKTFITSKNQKHKEHPLLFELCNILIYQENFGVKYEIGELLKSLLDNEVNEKKNEFYDLFYNKCLKKLVDFLHIPLKQEFKYEMISSKQIIIEILCHCLKQHEQRVRYWVIHNDLITKVIDVLSDKVKVLELQVIKFIKSIFLNKDENLNKLIINNNVMEPIIKLFNQNKTKNNLISSAILDLFEHIKKQNMKKIISYLFEKHYDFFYIENNNKILFADFIKVYEESIEQFSSIKVINNEPEDKMKYNHWNSREISAKEDEDYFNEDEEDEDDIFRGMNHINYLEIEKSNNENVKYMEQQDLRLLDEQNKAFLGKKKTSEQDLLNVYKEIENEEINEISKDITKKKKLYEDEEL